MNILLFGAGHQTEQARKRRRSGQQVRRYGGYISYPNTPNNTLYATSPNAKSSKRSSTFPSYFDTQASASGSSSTTTAASHPSQSSPFLPGTDTFRRSPEPETSPISQPDRKRKADEMESADNPEHDELKQWATKPKRRPTLDPEKRAEAQAYNKRIQDARNKCEDLGIPYEKK